MTLTRISLFTVEEDEQNDESQAASSNISKVFKSSKSLRWHVSALANFSMNDNSTESYNPFPFPVVLLPELPLPELLWLPVVCFRFGLFGFLMEVALEMGGSSFFRRIPGDGVFVETCNRFNINLCSDDLNNGPRLKVVWSLNIPVSRGLVF